MFKMLAAFMAASSLALSACGGPTTQTIGKAEAVNKASGANPVSDAERFRVQSQMPGAMAGAPATPAAVAVSFAFQTPEGWQAVPATSMRNPNFVIGGTPEAPKLECYVTRLNGEAGGLTNNVNRWRGQMGLSPLSEAEIAALPKVKMLGGDATLVELKGTFAGMAPTATPTPAPGQDEMIGVLLMGKDRSVTVKMIGPASAATGQLEKFKAFCSSLKEQAGVAEAAAPAAGMGAMPSDSMHAGLMGAMGSSTATLHAAAGATAAAAAPAKYQWTKPASWKDAGPAMMRDANFKAGPKDEVECYLSVLGGDAGGLESNINRWRDQMGQKPLAAAALADLPQIKIMGHNSPLVAIDGTYSGMAGQPIEKAELLGVVCLLGDHSLFIKMTGPKVAVEAERKAFMDFCQSLKEATGAAQ